MKISVSTGWLEKKLCTQKMFRMMKEAGIDAADYGLSNWIPNIEALKQMDDYKRSDEEVIAHYTAVRKMAEAEGIEIYQTHAIFGAFAICDTPEYRDITRKHILATYALGARYTVIHPIATPGRIMDEKKEECFAYNLDLFRAMLPHLHKYGVKIGVEPMWTRDRDGIIRPTVCSRPEEILEFINVLGNEHFCACFDYGHVALTGNDTGDTVGGAIRKLGKAMEIVHIHEVDGIQDNHTAPYSFHGTMDWEDIIAAMHEIGYAGTVNFEVGGQYYAKYPERLLPEALRHLAAIGKDIIG